MTDVLTLNKPPILRPYIKTSIFTMCFSVVKIFYIVIMLIKKFHVHLEKLFDSSVQFCKTSRFLHSYSFINKLILKHSTDLLNYMELSAKHCPLSIFFPTPPFLHYFYLLSKHAFLFHRLLCYLF